MTHSAPTPTDANTLRGFESESGAVGVGQSRSAAAGPSGPEATPCEAAAGSVLPSTPFSQSEDFHIEDAQTNMLTNRRGLQPGICHLSCKLPSCDPNRACGYGDPIYVPKYICVPTKAVPGDRRSRSEQLSGSGKHKGLKLLRLRCPPHPRRFSSQEGALGGGGVGRRCRRGRDTARGRRLRHVAQCPRRKPHAHAKCSAWCAEETPSATRQTAAVKAACGHAAPCTTARQENGIQRRGR